MKRNQVRQILMGILSELSGVPAEQLADAITDQTVFFEVVDEPTRCAVLGKLVEKGVERAIHGWNVTAESTFEDVIAQLAVA